MLAFIEWTASPEIFSSEYITIRWYGLFFAFAFLVGQQMMVKFYKEAQKPLEDLETLLVFMIVATVVGARLGHCLFYQPDFYLSHPIEILKIWRGGLASHGAAFGILFSLWLYARNREDQPYLWVVDRIVITVAFGAIFIRLGNLMNSEIIGLPTDMPWGFKFIKAAGLTPEEAQIPRHPTQIYESLCYLLTFLTLWFTYAKYKAKTPFGLLLGIFLIMTFGSRMLVELFKENQVNFEEGMLLNMGQLLSIPLVLAGGLLVLRALKNGPQEAPPSPQPLKTPKKDSPQKPPKAEEGKK